MTLIRQCSLSVSHRRSTLCGYASLRRNLCSSAIPACLRSGPSAYQPASLTLSFLNRITPVVDTCSASSLEAVEKLARAIISPALISAAHSEIRWRVDAHYRSHTAPCTRTVVTELIGRIVLGLGLPSVRVDLTNPTHVILVEVHKSVAGIAVVENELYDGPRGGRRFGCVDERSVCADLAGSRQSLRIISRRMRRPTRRCKARCTVTSRA